MTTKIQAEPMGDLAERVGRDAIVAVGFAEHGPPTILATDARDVEVPFERTGNGTTPRRTAARAWPARVHRPDGSTASLGALTTTFPSIQALPGGEVVVVAGRCRSGEANAQVFAADGRRMRAFAVGDAVQSVQATASGDLWVGWFDEGYGGPVSQGNVLARFSAAGEIVYRYLPPPDRTEPLDCYALNVGDDGTTWLCAYPDFDLVRIDGRGTTAYANQVAGATAMAAHGGRVLFHGGYGDDRNRARMGRLAKGQVLGATHDVHLVDGRHRLRPDTAVGRGRYLHLLVGTRWWRIDLATVA